MTKYDKQFLTGLIGQQDKKFTGLFKRLEGKIEGVESSLGEQIHKNGILIENLDTALCGVADGVSDLNRRMKNVEINVADIKKTICDYPIIRNLVQKHEKQLAKLN